MNVRFVTAPGFSVRSRLLLLVVVTLLPAALLMLWSASQQRHAMAKQTQNDALIVARQIALDQQSLVEGARQLLTALAQTPGIRSGDRQQCSLRLAEILRRFPFYGNLGSSTPMGDVTCSAVPSRAAVNIADRVYFKEALRTRDFAVGNYVIGRFTGRPAVTFAYPVVDSRRDVEAVLFASMDLGWLERHLAGVQLPDGSTLTLVDSTGTILARQPADGAWIGKHYAVPSVLAALAERHEGVIDSQDVDGRDRLMAFAPLLSKRMIDGPRTIVAIPTEVALAPVNRIMVRSLTGLVVAAILAFGLAKLVSDAFILRRLREVMSASQRLGSGDLGARVGGPYSRSELDHLARTFDQMASNIERLTDDNRLILDAAGEGIYGIDANGRVTFVNPAATLMSGYTREELLGQPMHRVLHHSHRDGSPYPAEACPTSETLRLGAVRHVAGDVFWRKDHSGFPVEYVSTPIRRAGEIVGAVVTFKDVTERERVTAELERQREALHQTEKVATMGSLLAGVAHELNNPLAVVMGMAHLLKATTGGTPQATRAEKIHAAAERCARIVKNFLALARQRPPERSEVQLNQVVREAVELLAYELRSENMEVTFDLADDLPALWADAHQLHQVVVNLVGNAHQAMRRQPGPRRIALRTRVTADQNAVQLDVSDTGPGIPVDIQQRIFEPFFTTKPPGQGTGLGLSLCRNMVAEHGGALFVTSAPGEGATFTLSLPVQNRTEGERHADIEDGAQPMDQIGTILVVDDEPDIAAIVAETLEKVGHRVHTANDGVTALHLLGETVYDLIISDTKMPAPENLDFYTELMRRHPEFGRRIIFITGDVLDPEKQKFLERTGAPCITKPFDPRVLPRVVRRALASSSGSPASA